DRDDAIFLALDAELFSSKPINDEVFKLSKIFGLMNINAFLFSKPAEPYWSIIKEILRIDTGATKVIPMDCETRTFFHDIPVIDEFSPHAISAALSERKSAIIRGKGIVTYGTVTPEQAFVSFSSTCFSTFVKYFYDSLLYFEDCYLKGLPPDPKRILKFKKIITLLQPSGLIPKPLINARPETEDDVIRMISEAGRAVVDARLVDSYFGNISYVYRDSLYISQTGSSMDELECCIDA
ncbi:MAG: rRNA adenine dimethylase, partial [Thermodesulfovibrionales bacterium]